MKQLLFIALCCTVFAGCSKGEVEEIPAKTKITLKATIEKEAITRAQVGYGNTDLTAGEMFEWTAGDAIHVSITNLSFEAIAANISGKNCDFVVDWEGMPSGDTPIKAYYPGSVDINSFLNESVQIPVVQTQAGNSTTHLRNTMWMGANSTINYSGSGDAVFDLNFKHLTSLFRFYFLNATEETLEVKKIVLSGVHNNDEAHQGLFMTSDSFDDNFNRRGSNPLFSDALTLNISPSGTFETKDVGQVFSAYMSVLGLNTPWLGGYYGGIYIGPDKLVITVSLYNEARSDFDIRLILPFDVINKMIEEEYGFGIPKNMDMHTIFKPGSRYYFKIKIAKSGDAIVLQ